MKKFLIYSAGILIILIIAVGCGHFYGLNNLSGYELNNFATVETTKYSTNLERGSDGSTGNRKRAAGFHFAQPRRAECQLVGPRREACCAVVLSARVRQ